MLSILSKPIIIILFITAIAGGTYFYFQKTNPGLVLGTTNEIKDFIGEKVPQSKPLLEKISPEKAEQIDLSNQNQSITELKTENTFLKESLEITNKQLEVLKEKSTEVKNHLVTLTQEVKEASSGSEIQQKAFEYGQYVYCQQVVNEYQTN